MRLKKIKLAGFKSFVDPTTVEFPHLLTGVVGPNGCGKSNIIDAVRWVMGESSAKNLRGESMEDVIFSGSQSRKPVGKAFVELIFDNTVGKKAPGDYARYSEISIRRELSRDERSDYFLNRTRCRKKDITGIFLGTGLGPRAYSIIEQGMVTRIIESRPEDLRVFVEEAAGISRYKERRRETENRIHRTRENLSRVDDIRSELETQLARLKRQASAARRYKEHKLEERQLQGELLTLRWKGLTEQIQCEEVELGKRQTELDGQLAKLRETENGIEKKRQQLHDLNESLNQAQGNFYQAGAEVTRLEQSIKHVRDTHQEKLREKLQLGISIGEAQNNYLNDSKQEKTLTEKLQLSESTYAELLQKSEKTTASLAEAETVMRDWQQRWESFSTSAAQPAREKEVQSARILQINDHLQGLQRRRARLDDEKQWLSANIHKDNTTELRQQLEKRLAACTGVSVAIELLDKEISGTRQQIEKTSSELSQAKVSQQHNTSRLETLRELQDAALGRKDQSLPQWLQQTGLVDTIRLADAIQVEAGWENAVDRVLGSALKAVCLHDQKLPFAALDELVGKGSTFFEHKASGSTPEQTLLLSRISSTDVDLNARLANIYIAENVEKAIAMRSGLPAEAVTVTRDGTLVGHDWLSLTGGQENEVGVMACQAEIENLAGQQESSKSWIEELAARFNVLQKKLSEKDALRHDNRRQLNRETAKNNEDNAQLHRLEAQLDQVRRRLTQVDNELSEIDEQVVNDQSELTTSDGILHDASRNADEIEQQREELLAARTAQQVALDKERQEARSTNESLHHLQLKRQEWEISRRSLQESVRRGKQQIELLKQRENDLNSILADGKQPERVMQEQLVDLLQQKVEQETILKNFREQTNGLDQETREMALQRQNEERACTSLREALEQEKMKRQEQFVRRQTLEEQLDDLELEVEEILASLPAEADFMVWEEKLETITRKITRLGAVNLMAIEEFEERSERKDYLDKQHADLSEALSTLEGVMGKIDRETRTRFKETFDLINGGFQRFFPKLFGGGHAYLELTGDDLLDAGVAVMARPPGKRNSTIHLLSGGEKALTAVAMLFSIFELNPAPFCLLDEVDAPLDDTNVARYCETLKSMTDHTQLIYITHNKVTMESAGTLIGVTMAEAGVSRIVSVNLNDAEQLVAG
ncbi:MAG: chromosome segregation protein SMC [Gammaproteobacteria bacterium]|nr:MAG: chromosome segregation protein SMC [Gammaproteobacteria bacterium]